MHVKIKGNQAFIDGKPYINKTGSQYIDGPPVNKNQKNRRSTCTGIPVGSRTEDYSIYIYSYGKIKIVLEYRYASIS